ncbi:MAG: Fic family protein [Candidatus Cryptobacteroides sp.]
MEVLKEYQDKHGNNLVIKGVDVLGRTHTERLVDSGYLQMVIKGWYIPSTPGNEGDSTVWYVSYWPFVVAYLNSKFGNDWCLSPELSLYVYSGMSVIPKQLIVRCASATNNILQLPFGTSILDIRASVPSTVEREHRYGLHLYPLSLALLLVGPDYYRKNALEARTCLASLRDVSPIISAAIDGGHSTRAGRVAGALRSIGREEMADALLSTMRQVGYKVTEENPFEDDVRLSTFESSPYASRIRLMWMKMREVVLSSLSTSGILPQRQESESILTMMDATYVKDSYNSLSIEGYKITEDLLEKVRSGEWDPQNDVQDKERKNALAARGYYQAYQMLRESIASVLSGKSAAEMYVKDHREWHFQLFEPCIRSGIIKASDLLGYRIHPVYIRNSMHVPMDPGDVMDAMTTLSALMKEEDNAFVRAVLGHFFFVYIHPYMDGNGRTARFVMNSQFVTGGYPWVIVPIERRNEYMASLEKASVEEDIEPFVNFIASLIHK